MSSAKADVKEEVEAARAEGAAAAGGDAPAAAAASTAAAAPPEKKKEPTLIRGSLLLPTMSDADADKQLSFADFSALVGEREGFDDEEHLKALFEEFDTDKSGTVDMCEYLEHSLINALQLTQEKALDFFEEWDHDGNGEIDETEWTQLLTFLNYGVPPKVMKALFKKLDESGDGKIQRAEFANALAKKAAKNEKRSKLLRDPPNLKSAEDMAGLTTRNHNYVASRVKALPTCAQLDPNDELSVEEQLGMLLTLHRTTIMQLFHDWDIDGNGGVDKKEFRKAIALLGYSVKKKQIDALRPLGRRQGGLHRLWRAEEGASQAYAQVDAAEARPIQGAEDGPTDQGRQAADVRGVQGSRGGARGSPARITSRRPSPRSTWTGRAPSTCASTSCTPSTTR